MNPLAEKPGRSTTLAARRDRSEHRVGGRVDVEQGKRRHEPVGGGEAHPVREALPRHHVREMRLHHELGPAGRPRRRDHHRDVVGIDTGRTAAVGLGVEELRDVVVVDDQRGRDLAHEAIELDRGAGRIDGHLDRADLHQREPRQEIVGGVARGHQHPVARTDAVGTQRARGPLDARRPPARRCTRRSSASSHTLSGTASAADRRNAAIVCGMVTAGVSRAISPSSPRHVDRLNG